MWFAPPRFLAGFTPRLLLRFYCFSFFSSPCSILQPVGRQSWGQQCSVFTGVDWGRPLLASNFFDALPMLARILFHFFFTQKSYFFVVFFMIIINLPFIFCGHGWRKFFFLPLPSIFSPLISGSVLFFFLFFFCNMIIISF